MGDREREKGKGKMPEYEESGEGESSEDSAHVTRRTTEGPDGQSGASGNPSMPPLEHQDERNHNWPGPQQLSAAESSGEEGGPWGPLTQDLISQIDRHVDFPELQDPVIRHCVLDALSTAQHQASGDWEDPDTLLEMNFTRRGRSRRRRQRRQQPVIGPIPPPIHISDHLQQGQGLLTPVPSGTQKEDTSHEGGHGVEVAASASGQPQPRANAAIFYQCPACHNDPRGDQCLLCRRKPKHVNPTINPAQHQPPHAPQQGLPAAPTSHTTLTPLPPNNSPMTGARLASTMVPQPRPQAPSSFQAPRMQQPYIGPSFPRTHISDYLPQGQGFLMRVPISGAQRGNTSGDCSYGRGLQIAGQPGAVTGALGSVQPQPPSWMQNPEVIRSLMAALNAAHHRESGSVGNPGTLMPPPQAGMLSSSSQMQTQAPGIAGEPGTATGDLGSGQPQLPSWTQDPKVIRSLMAALDAAHRLESGGVGNPGRSLPDSSTGASGSGQPQHPASAVIQCPACHNNPHADRCQLCGREAGNLAIVRHQRQPPPPDQQGLPPERTNHGALVAMQRNSMVTYQHVLLSGDGRCPACRSRPGWAAPYPWLHFCLCAVCHLSRECPWCAQFLPLGLRLRRWGES